MNKRVKRNIENTETQRRITELRELIESKSNENPIQSNLNETKISKKKILNTVRKLSLFEGT